MSNSAPKHRVTKQGRAEPARRARARLERRWPRRTLITVNGLVLLCLAATATGYAYVRHEVASITTLPGPDVISPGFTVGGSLPPAEVKEHNGLEPENILLIGNETRQGLTPQEQQEWGSSLIYSGTLADIIMILHLDPTTGTASVLSIPRDLFSPMPAGSPVGPYEKIDAALNDGNDGPDNLVAAIEQDYGIPINHFIELNFNGFINSVNALGGINVYFPEPVYDQDSLLYISTKGCQHLDGFEALALVRARHLQYDPPGDDEPRGDWPYDPESDLARIVRTHTFMKIVAGTAIKEGKTNPFTALSFINAILKQITVDAKLKDQLIHLVARYRDINPATVPETTLATSGVPDAYYYAGADIGDVLFPVQPKDNRVIKAWDPQAFPKQVAPRSVSVVSIDGNSEDAVTAGQDLVSEGMKVTSETTGDEPTTPTETLVLYHSLKDVGRALYVMKYFSGAVMMELSSAVPVGTIEVEVGSVVSVASKPTTTTSTTTTTVAGATTTSGTTTAAPATTSSPSTTTTTRAEHTTVARPVANTTVARPVATTTTVPTPDGVVSSSSDQEEPWDPRACPS